MKGKGNSLIVMSILNLSSCESISPRNLDYDLFKSSWGNVQYKVVGEGTPVLISHGVTGGIDQGFGITRTYFNKNYKFILISRMGYLDSDIPDNPSAEIQAHIYRELLDYIGIKSTVLLGNSAGGTSAIKFAELYPESCKALILLSSNLPGEVSDPPPKIISNLIFGNNHLYSFILDVAGLEMFVKGFMSEEKYKKLDPEEKKYIINNIFKASLPVNKKKRGILFDFYISNPSINSVNFLTKEITVPVLFLHGKYDKSLPYNYIEDLKSRMHNTKTILYNSGHLLYGKEYLIKKDIDIFLRNILKN